jgi:hypothetical protein
MTVMSEGAIEPERNRKDQVADEIVEALRESGRPHADRRPSRDCRRGRRRPHVQVSPARLHRRGPTAPVERSARASTT